MERLEKNVREREREIEKGINNIVVDRMCLCCHFKFAIHILRSLFLFRLVSFC